ncbi:MAG: hypothetical protein OEU50_19960 [Gammaproteobacteria bacterium]|nr:hypothetical protein [Gammaproteobacteria bacterium]
MHLLEKVPAAILVLLAVISINLGSAIAIQLFATYTVLGLLLLRMLLGALMLAIAYRSQLIGAMRRAPLGILLLGVTIALQSKRPKRFGVLVAMEPVVAAIVGAFALSQFMGVRVWLAIILISAAAMITSMMARDSTPKDRQAGEFT